MRARTWTRRSSTTHDEVAEAIAEAAEAARPGHRPPPSPASTEDAGAEAGQTTPDDARDAADARRAGERSRPRSAAPPGTPDPSRSRLARTASGPARSVSLLEALAIFAAGLAAGTINTIVGSGTLVTFPTLLAVGYPPVLANVSNTVGLVPGSVSGVLGYRRELRGSCQGCCGSAPRRFSVA